MRFLFLEPLIDSTSLALAFSYAAVSAVEAPGDDLSFFCWVTTITVLAATPIENVFAVLITPDTMLVTPDIVAEAGALVLAGGS